MFLKNQILFSNYNNLNLNFYENLTNKDSIIIKSCKDITFKISSKVNKIIIINSFNINIILGSTIAGIDIENSKNVTIIPTNPYDLKMIHCFKSILTLGLDQYLRENIINKNLFIINNEYSSISIEDI